ncbi:DUF4479 family protein [Alkalibacterium iburiense]|uniref:DUF4479 family protein n=1 Tax=Alkalibacterium iburiense TaxID=290589 RepID=A0ABP3HDV7_9LACT
MYISSYNNKGLNDVLMIILEKSDAIKQTSERHDDIVAIRDRETGKLVGINLFRASTYLSNLENGPVVLTEDNRSALNDLIKKAHIDLTLEANEDPKFVVGFVQSCEPVVGSDHLNLTQTEVDNGQTLQIVCGASNISQGQKVVVAKVGAVMPDGLVIWPGQLKGVDSYGMICSARELGLRQETDGIMVLDDSAEVGSPFIIPSQK